VAVVAADYARFRETIERFVRASTRDTDAAADATQEAFTRLFREAQAGRYPGNVRAWLYRTAMNVVVSDRRHAAVVNRMAPRLVRLDEPLTPDLLAIERERSASLREAVDHLSPTQRTALYLAATGVPGEAIASRIGRTYGATRTLMSRARGRLRRELALQGAA
jgi:RNA polymerase sigma factor (sigma-70 family)